MPTDAPDLDAEQDVDLHRHWDSITRHWWLPLGGLAAGIIIGYLISLGGAQVYKAKAVVYLGQPLSQGGVQVQSQATNPSTVKQIVTAESTIQRVAHFDPPGFRSVRSIRKLFRSASLVTIRAAP